jgi:DNA-directed RNA polymerase specialized sigma24 family protein
MDTSDLIQSAQHGDLLAFNHLVMQYQDSLYNFIFHVLADETAAAEATQAAFLDAYAALPQYRQQPVDEWMFSAAARVCLRRLRSRQHPGWRLLPASAGRGNGSRASHSPPEGCLASALVDVEGLDYDCASRVLGISPTRLRNCLAKARQAAAGA